jgi:polyferredoxin/Flp pilus assembly protein TadD
MKSDCRGTVAGVGRTVELPVLNNFPPQKTEIRRSGTAPWRAAALITLTLLMIAHFIQWRIMGETISPIEPSETMYTLQRGAVNAGFIFFALAILSTLVFGRFVCGWGCHIVALQDLCAWLLKKVGLVPKPFRSRLLVFVPLLAALYMFVWPTATRLLAASKDEPLFPQFTNHLITTNFWETFPPMAVAIPFLFICGFMTVYFLGSKGFCTYACPYGGFFAVADRFSPGRIRVTDACSQCGHCTAVCTSNVLVHAEVKQFGMVTDPGCMKCMDCVSVCPNDALYFGFGKPSITVGAPATKNYSLSWTEEIIGSAVFLASFLAVWDVYQLVPMLMALGIASITAFITLKSVRIAIGEQTSFLGFLLKGARRIEMPGWIFLGFALLWIGLCAHSGWVRYHERAGSMAFEKLQIPDELALARIDPKSWLSAGDRENVRLGKQHLGTAQDLGLFTNKDALPKLAWFEYLSGNAERSVELLTLAAEKQHGTAQALSLYYRGAILNRSKQYEKALMSLDQALAERPDMVAAREERGESLWQLGRKQEAVAEWQDVISKNEGLVLAKYLLSGAAASLGLPEAAFAYEKLAEDATPADPYFHYMIGLRLENIGMYALAEKHFARAIQLDPQFRGRRSLDQLNRL